MKKSFSFIFCLFLSGCASFDIAKPITPESRWPHKAVEVNSLQPVLKWEAKFDGPADLILFNGPYTEDEYICCGKQSTPLEMIYIEPNIVGTEHKVKAKLEPNRAYFWAVRKSGKSEPGNEWSNYEYFAFYGVAWSYYRNQFFKFKTPKN